MEQANPRTTRPVPPSPPPLIWAITGIFVVIEGIFQLGDAGILGVADLRWQGYFRLAFFQPLFNAGLVGEAVPFTTWTGLLTHAFVHGGAVHLLVNSAVFLALGGMIANAIGTVRFLILFVVTALGGILLLTTISTFNGPVVGASGVVFGLFGAVKRWEWRHIQTTGAPSNRFWGTIIALIIMNLALAFYFPFNGALAWEAHLGGFIAGFLIAAPLAPRLSGPAPI